jgi:hypothetical protein
MGTPAGVSRYAAETLRGQRPAAQREYRKLTARIKD